MMSKRTALIDGDIVAYQISAKGQLSIDWDGNGEKVIVTENELIIRDMVRKTVESLMERTASDEAIICLSDDVNWRHAVYPPYKMNRKGLPKPELLQDCKQFLRDNFRTYERPTLEGDDVMGILATHHKLIPGEKVIVSIDKDMQQIPGWLFNPIKENPSIFITEEDADYYHLQQTLTGDYIDGYPGCPGVGPKKAQRILEDYYNLEIGAKEAWRKVVETYESKGLTEEDALVQARISRICRWTDYDYKRKEVKLWNPPID
jgi:5'-3' exonuclease